PQLEGSDVRHWKNDAPIAAGLKDSLNHFLVLPGQPAKKNGDFAAFLRRERPLHGTAKVMCAVLEPEFPGQTRTLGRELLLDIVLRLCGSLSQRMEERLEGKVDFCNCHRGFPRFRFFLLKCAGLASISVQQLCFHASPT